MKRTLTALAFVLLASPAFIAEAAPADGYHHCRAADGKVSRRYKHCKDTETLADIIEADEARVAKCQFIESVTASAMFGATQGLHESAEKRAAEKGATHIVWMPQANDGRGTTNVFGRAYKCEGQ